MRDEHCKSVRWGMTRLDEGRTRQRLHWRRQEGDSEDPSGDVSREGTKP
ncbi:MAG: hypothetical protein ACI8XM_002431 [Haloarculaceae archaeon]|jgi:hypothetical protein